MEIITLKAAQDNRANLSPVQHQPATMGNVILNAEPVKSAYFSTEMLPPATMPLADQDINANIPT